VRGKVIGIAQAIHVRRLVGLVRYEKCYDFLGRHSFGEADSKSLFSVGHTSSKYREIH